MNKRETIQFILDTYELSKDKRKNITNIASERIERLSLEKFEDIYRNISFLVEKFYQTPYQERFFTRLDGLVKEDSSTLFHELIQIPKYGKNDNKWLKDKLENLAREQGEQLTILGRRIIQIEPIKLGRRNYNENNTPLDLYESHLEVYAGKSRTELFQIDPSLYESFRRRGLLKKVIPYTKDTKFKGISKNKQKEIIKEIKIRKSPTAVAKKLGVTRATVDYYTLSKNKLRKPNKKTGNPGYPLQMINDLVECLRKCKKASKVAECYGISTFTVIKHGRRAEIPILPRGGDINNILKNRKPLSKTL